MVDGQPMRPTLPASDIERAKAWYRDKLGLDPAREDPGGVTYELNGGEFTVYPTQFAGTAQNTAAEIQVSDIGAAVDELSGRGVVFEQYDFPGLKTDERGIAVMGDTHGAWFKDSEGNILAVNQRMA